MKNNRTNTIDIAKSQTVAKFLAIFNYRYKFIRSLNPYFDQRKDGSITGLKRGKLKPDWRREGINYPIREKLLENLLQDPAELIGLSFGTKTLFNVLDIDQYSPIHPAINEEGFRKVLGHLEDIGLVSPVFVRSSHGGGLHVYYFFPEEVGTFNLACAMQGILADYGIKPQSGTLELFPNAKRHSKNQADSFYNAIRLPLQPMTGSYILDKDFNPISDSLEVFVRMAEQSAAMQDMEMLKEACEIYGRIIRLQRCSRSKKSLKKFQEDLQRSISSFTGKGQTNNLLLDIGCYGVVFERLAEPNQLEILIDYMVETVTSLEGYEKYCGHQHEIRKRCREVAKSCQAYYWAAGTERKREAKTYHDNFGRVLENIQNGNEAKHYQAIQKLETTIEHIEEQIIRGLIQLPATATAYIKLLVQQSKTIFDKGVSQSTLYKPESKVIWKQGFAVLMAMMPLNMTNISQPVEAAPTQMKITANQSLESNNQNTPEIDLKTSSETPEKFSQKVEPEKEQKPPSKIATSIENRKDFAPWAKDAEAKTPEPAETKEISHLGLYVGFGEHISSSQSKNPSALSLTTEPKSKSFKPFASPKPEITVEQKLKQFRQPINKANSANFASFNSPVVEASESFPRSEQNQNPNLNHPAHSEFEHLQATDQPPSLKELEHLQQTKLAALKALQQSTELMNSSNSISSQSVTPEQEAYAAEVFRRNPELRKLEAQENTATYQDIKKNAFERIRRILGGLTPHRKDKNKP